MDEDTILIVGIALGVLAIITVIARFAVRHNKKAGFKWDDWMILVSIVAMIITDVLAVYAIIVNPTGPEAATNATQTEHYSEADQEYTRLTWSLTVVYFFTVSSTKFSIVFMYHRLFYVDRSLRRQIWALSVIIGGYWIGCTGANLANCIPLKYTWVNSLADPRYCFNYNHYWFAVGIVEAVIDVLVLLLPIRVILKLQFSRQQKIAVIFVFLLGVLVIISGILKTAFGYIPGSRQPSFANTQLWTTIHICTGIICACLPICWPLITRLGRISPSTWSGTTWIRKYWYSPSGWSSREQQGSNRPTTDERRFNKLTNNFTSRGFDVTFSSAGGETQEDEYPLSKMQYQSTTSAV
ncbi:integral membrane protein [Stachybotrys elegans]|uniref:Integral membrane protein n=1 Tax=Stachybotrys elegans TaxID=80388 RepID=A0A8K0SIN5_9HYPO|nr:integral membrane protein [Stachybotrys elegans]